MTLTGDAGASPAGEQATAGAATVWRRAGDAVRRQLFGTHRGASTYYLTRRLFLSLLGVVYAIAFVSLAVQVVGLIGERGILPAKEFLDVIESRLGNERFWKVPTILWWFRSDAALQATCWAGAALSVLLVFGIAPIPVLISLWVLYLSICSVGRDFLSFQWDILLLETGLLATFLAPWRLLPNLRRESAPSPAGMFLLKWLLFRLMFLSGVVKLASGDKVWHDLTALTVHYETQPLAAWPAWYVHNFPLWWHKLSCGIMFFIELALPFFIWGPRMIRQFACFGFVFFMMLIGLTGNYNFFDLLACVLCVLLLDDAFLARWIPGRWRGRVEIERPYRRPRMWQTVLSGGVAAVVFAITWTGAQDRLWRGRTASTDTGIIRPQLDRIRERIAPFRSFNNYGLFANMTETRPEIVVEGSDDGQSWHAYEFRWKPGDLSRAPQFVQPHQPRLDWQMWFAALGDYRRTPWFQQFLRKLLEGSPEVSALLEKNPFPEKPPRYMRALLYQYRFTNREEWRATGHWWKREFLRVYCQPVSLNRR